MKRHEAEELLRKQRLVLQQLVNTVDATGGVMRDGKGEAVPVADEDWLDLALAYLDACRLLDREPLWFTGCQRCGAELETVFCSDETCPFSGHQQSCRAGWSGHPERDPFPHDDGVGPCAACTCGGRPEPKEE